MSFMAYLLISGAGWFLTKGSETQEFQIINKKWLIVELIIEIPVFIYAVNMLPYWVK
jgi:hypothetical protein